MISLQKPQKILYAQLFQCIGECQKQILQKCLFFSPSSPHSLIEELSIPLYKPERMWICLVAMNLLSFWVGDYGSPRAGHHWTAWVLVLLFSNYSRDVWRRPLTLDPTLIRWGTSRMELL